MEYYGASESDRAIISNLLNLNIADMGQDWEFTLSSPEVVEPSISSLLLEENSENIKMAISCILISSLYEYYRDTQKDHPLYAQALETLKKDQEIFGAMRSFWLSPRAKTIEYLDKILEI